MNKVKLLTIICISLLAANIFLIWFLMSHKPNQPSREGPKKIIVEKLHFDENQTSNYEKLIDWHRGEIRKAEEQMQDLKRKLYKTLTTEDSLSSKDLVIAEIGKLQVDIENIHYKHFQDIKKLCKPEQQKYFGALTLEISNFFPRMQNRQH